MGVTRPVEADGLTVPSRAVPLVRGKSVLGIPQVVLVHNAVPFDLGENGGGRDGNGETVALYDRSLRDVKIRNLHGIHEKKARWGTESAYRFPHSPQRRLENIEAFNFSFPDGNNCPGEGLLADDRVHFFPLAGGKKLGIPHPGVGEVHGKDDGCGNHGAGKGTSPCLVHTGYEFVTGIPQFLFVNPPVSDVTVFPGKSSQGFMPLPGGPVSGSPIARGSCRQTGSAARPKVRPGRRCCCAGSRNLQQVAEEGRAGSP